ncbi:MAG TPA: hypothetical protein VFW40_09740 [Capsulimonadaceae bacterium]|nr:hypothetical protein [Capsulimonadaceae bacterium]
MVAETYSLKELTAKVARGKELTYAEARFVKQRYLQLREDCEQVLGACQQDEASALALRRALTSLEAKKISSSDYVLEVFDIQSEIFGPHKTRRHSHRTVASAKEDKEEADRRSEQRERRLTKLRETVAYRMAMAALFFSHAPHIGQIKQLPNLTQELLFQMDHLDVSVTAHDRAIRRQQSHKPGETDHN